MLIVTPQVKGVQFHIASWSYPDEFGQGTDIWYASSNATGSWVDIESNKHDEEEGPVPWNVSQVIRIGIWTTLNYTLLGLDGVNGSDIILGQNYIRHNVTVTDQWGAVVFSQQNFTCDYNASYAGVYWYRYFVILNFLPLEGEFYTVTIRTQIYW